MSESVSLNKFISDTGYCSRRQADELIRAGRVLLNDKPAQPGNRYTPGDQVEVDGSLITPDKKEKPVYLAFHKPVGITTTTEEQVRDNIISYINYPKRIFPIGRLDKDSSGLIFLTNNGDIVNKLLRAGNEHEKEYIVRVNKPLATGFAEKMSGGVPLSEGRTLPCKVQVLGRQQFRITLVQGLNRQIRRMCEYLGYSVMTLQRVRIMNVQLGKLAIGKWRYLSDTELSALLESIKHSTGIAPKKVKTGRKVPASHAPKIARPGKPVQPAKAAKPAKSTKPAQTAKAPVKQEKDKKPIGKYKAFRQKGRSR
jgi:23S rRNA pseudouridine2604 synthase